MNLKFHASLLFLGLCISAIAQQSQLQINPNIVLPKDSILNRSLISSLNDFLASAQKANNENQYVLESEKAETFVLLDEIHGIEKSKKFNDDYFFKPYLTNVVLLNDKQYSVQISYVGLHEGAAILRGSFELIAYQSEKSFIFSSPLKLNTKKWKAKQIGSVIFHYPYTINKTDAKKFSELVSLYDRKLNSNNKTTELYCCENLTELQRLLGIQYKLDYNGRQFGSLNSSCGNKEVIVLGNTKINELDSHDLWHERLSLVIPRSKVNKPVDEGCAYLYGGSWGLSWTEIYTEFKRQIASNKNTNWAEIKENPVFFTTKEFKNSADYIINALLVQKIEREKGFAGVWELLNCGKYEKGNENYYKVLEKLTGITKQNYNDKIWALINNH